MKTKILISLLGILLIAGAFGEGCEDDEPKPDYITVVVTAGGFVFEMESTTSQNYMCSELCKNFQVKILVYKDGALKLEDYQVTSDICSFNSNSVTIKLYNQQPIDIKVMSKNDIPGYTENIVTYRLSWDAVYPQYDFGDTYYFDLDVRIFLTPE